MSKSGSPFDLNPVASPAIEQDADAAGEIKAERSNSAAAREHSRIFDVFIEHLRRCLAQKNALPAGNWVGCGRCSRWCGRRGVCVGRQ